MTDKERSERIIEYFERTMPDPRTELRYGSPFQLLVAVVLSAQCTDARVNTVTPQLFAAYPTARDMARATAADILPHVRSVSYPNAKAAHLAALARMLEGEHGGRVPRGQAELERLPGVGRKTANVIRAVVFGEAAMAVDTHVFRVSRRLGIVPRAAATPLAVERALVRLLPASVVPRAHHWLLLHGRHVCQSRRPKCEACGLRAWCRSAAAEIQKNTGA